MLFENPCLGAFGEFLVGGGAFVGVAGCSDIGAERGAGVGRGNQARGLSHYSTVEQFHGRQDGIW